MSAPLRLEDGARGRALHRALEPELLRALAEGRSGGGFGERDGLAYYLKFSPLRSRARVRHALRLAAGLGLPRLREFENLRWLRAHGFDAARPLVAGALGPRHAPRFQYLATERVPAARTLRAVLTEEAPEAPLRRRALEELARVTARLHGAGFVHRDLFPRNLLVSEAPEVRVHLLDAWRGGPGRVPGTRARSPVDRGPAYDLGCLFVFASALLEEQEQRAFLEGYARGRALAPAEARDLVGRAAAHRARIVRRLLRRGRNDPPVPRETWRPPALELAGEEAETRGVPRAARDEA